MLLKLLPAPPAPTIHFSLNFAELPPTLPSPSTWTAQIAHLMLEDLRAPSSIHCLDRAVGISCLLEEVAFDIEHGLVRCRFVDGSIEEWAFDTNTKGQPRGVWTLMLALEAITRDVRESTLEDERFMKEERDREQFEREREMTGKANLARTPTLSRKPSLRWNRGDREKGHKRQRSFFMQFVSHCVGSIIHLTSPRNGEYESSDPSSENTLSFHQTSFPTSPSPTSPSFPVSPPHSAPPILQSHHSIPMAPSSAWGMSPCSASSLQFSLPSPHKGQIPITPPVPGASVLARALRRSARSALVDAYRLFVLEELKNRFPVPTVARIQDANERGLLNAMGFGGEAEVTGNPNDAWHAESRSNGLANKRSAFMIWTLHSSRWRALQRMRDLLIETGTVLPDAQIDAAGERLSDAKRKRLGPDAWAVDWSSVDVEIIRDVTGTPMAVSVIDSRGIQRQAGLESRPLLQSEQSNAAQADSSVNLSGPSPPSSTKAQDRTSEGRLSVDSQSGFEATTMNVPDSFSDDESVLSESQHDIRTPLSPTDTDDNQTLETATDGSSLHTPTSASHEHGFPIIVNARSKQTNEKDLPDIPSAFPVLPVKVEATGIIPSSSIRRVHMMPRLALQEYAELHALRGRLSHLLAFSASQDRIMREEVQNRFQILAVRSRRRAWSGIGWSLGRQGPGKERGHWKAQLDSSYGLAAPFRSSPLARYSWVAPEASTVPFPTEDTFESTSIEILNIGDDLEEDEEEEEEEQESLKTCSTPVSRHTSASSTISEVSSIFSQGNSSVNTEATSIDVPLSDEMFILGDDEDDDDEEEEEEDSQVMINEVLDELQAVSQALERPPAKRQPVVTAVPNTPTSPPRSKSRNALSLALAKVKAKAMPTRSARPSGSLPIGLAVVKEEPEATKVDAHDVPEDIESWRISQRRKRTKLMRQKRERGMDERRNQTSPVPPVPRVKTQREMTFMGCDEVAVEGEEDEDTHQGNDIEVGPQQTFAPYVRVRTGPSTPASWTQDTLPQESILCKPLSSGSSMSPAPILRTIDVAARPSTPPPLSPPLSRDFSGSRSRSGRTSDNFEGQGSTFEYEMAGYGHFTSPRSQSALRSDLIKEFTLSINLPQRQRILTPSMSSGSSPKVNFAPLPSRAFDAPASSPEQLQKMRRRRMDREKAETLEMIFAPGPGKNVADLCAVQGV